MDSIRPLVVSLALFVWTLGQAVAAPRIINGVAVPAGKFREVVQVRVAGSLCTGTLVGPNAVITAAHCAPHGSYASVIVNGKAYSGKVFRHPDYPNRDIDVALMKLDIPVQNVKPVQVGGMVVEGDTVFLLGYGCTVSGGGGGNDGVLRIGQSRVSKFQDFDIVSNEKDGGALCFGDSGGPTYVKEEDKYQIVGVASKGNIQDTNYSAHLATSEVRSFLNATASAEKLTICGINSDCDESQSGAPKFKNEVTTYKIRPKQTYYVSLSTLLAVPVKGLTWTLDSTAPNWMDLNEDVLSLHVPEDAVGTYEVSVTARNSEGVAATLLSFIAVGNAPVLSCTMKATPDFVETGEEVQVAMKIEGEANEVTINGKTVDPTEAKLTLTAKTSGVFVVRGTVKGPAGEASCLTRYAVK